MDIPTPVLQTGLILASAAFGWIATKLYDAKTKRLTTSEVYVTVKEHDLQCRTGRLAIDKLIAESHSRTEEVSAANAKGFRELIDYRLDEGTRLFEVLGARIAKIEACMSGLKVDISATHKDVNATVVGLEQVRLLLETISSSTAALKDLPLKL